LPTPAVVLKPSTSPLMVPPAKALGAEAVAMSATTPAPGSWPSTGLLGRRDRADFRPGRTTTPSGRIPAPSFEPGSHRLTVRIARPRRLTTVPTPQPLTTTRVTGRVFSHERWVGAAWGPPERGPAGPRGVRRRLPYAQWSGWSRTWEYVASPSSRSWFAQRRCPRGPWTEPHPVTPDTSPPGPSAEGLLPRARKGRRFARLTDPGSGRPSRIWASAWQTTPITRASLPPGPLGRPPNPGCDRSPPGEDFFLT